MFKNLLFVIVEFFRGLFSRKSLRKVQSKVRNVVKGAPVRSSRVSTSPKFFGTFRPIKPFARTMMLRPGLHVRVGTHPLVRRRKDG